MFIQFTEKQYKLFVRIMQVMQVFYGNDFSSICKEVGEAYGAKKADIENAYTILTDVKVTGPVPAMQNAARKILNAALSAVDIKSAVKEENPYTRLIEMDEASWLQAADILDVYSRILMGQFSIIYESLDIANCYGADANEIRLQAYHDARWGGVGVIEARELLIPQLKKLGVGWNGNFGISKPGLAYDSKLSYEMLKVIRYAYGKGDNTVLKVTDEPFLRAQGVAGIRAL